MKIQPMTSFHGALTIPGDKSITHRAVMLSAVAEGTAVIRNALLGEDCLATIECMRALGAAVIVDGTTVTVTGAKKLKSRQTLNVGNSGTTMRLLTGLLAGRHIGVTLDGDESIRRRPMERVILPLREMGAKIDSTDGHAPLKIHPSSLHGIHYDMPIASAQVKSALLFAGLTAEGATVVTEPAATRNHSEIMLASMSADIKVKGRTSTVKTGSLKSVDMTVPADISSAAYPMVLATCLEGASVVLKGVGVNPTRRAIIDVINAHGGRITLLNKRVVSGEKVADLMVESAVLRPFDLGGDIISNVIDEIPVLAVMAAMIQGESRIRDARELRVKESDRIASMAAALASFGVHATATDDGMIIKGSGVVMGGGSVDPCGDHRVALSMAIAAALSLKGGEIQNDEVVNISYPDFYETVLKNK